MSTLTLRRLDFFAKWAIETPEGCWEWQGRRNKGGYGLCSGKPGNPSTLAHRALWVHINGPVPDGLCLDHLCRNRACINPSHLEPVTLAENNRRGSWCSRVRTHCPQGHPYEGKNVYVHPSGTRVCLTCRREWSRAYRRRLTLASSVIGDEAAKDSGRVA